jgi:biotin carboxyl carrier protein
MKSYKITVNGQSYDVTVEEKSGPAGASAPQPIASQAAAPAPAAVSSASSGAGVSLRSPMPGTLLSFKVSKGQAVKAGQVLLILEAMKMENEIVAPASGTVAALCVAEGASVNTGDVLVEIA